MLSSATLVVDAHVTLITHMLLALLAVQQRTTVLTLITVGVDVQVTQIQYVHHNIYKCKSNTSLLGCLVTQIQHPEYVLLPVTCHQLTLPDLLVSDRSQGRIQPMITECVPLLLREETHAPIEVIRSGEVQHCCAELLSRVVFHLPL